MIKVFMSGTPVYKLCFNRRKYSQMKRKHIGLDRIIKAIADAKINTREGHIAALKAVFVGKPLYETTAIIYLADAKKGEAPVARATVRQNPSDCHTPEGGRIAAIKKLLNTDPNLFNGYRTTFGKGEREAIWNAYINRPKGKPDVPPSGAPAKEVAPVPTRSKAVTAISPRPQGKKTTPPPGVVNKVVGFFATNRRIH